MLSGLGSHLEPVFLQPEEHRDARAASSGCRLASGWHLELVFLQLGERRDVRAAWSGCHLAPAWPLEPVSLQPGERRGVRTAWCQAPASLTVWASLLGQQVSSSGELPVPRATGWAFRSGQAVPQGPPKVACLQQAEVSAREPDAPVLPRAAVESVWVRAAAGPEEASARAAAELPPEEAAVSAHVAAEPRPEAASAPWVQQAAAEEPDGSRAAQPAASGETAQQPAEVLRADAVGQPPAVVRPVPWAQQAAELGSPGARWAAAPLALPSEAASVFRQGPILAGPARPRAATRFAHAMRSLQIASRSEPSSQAARNEGWSCGSTSPEGSLTKCWFDEVLG